MASFINVLVENLRPYKKYILILALVIFFAIGCYFLYFRLIKPQMKSTEKGYNNIANRDKNLNSNCELLFFNASWCPHCVKSKPDWEKFTLEYNGKKINKYKIVCTNVDCSDEDNEMSNSLLQKYNIEGYPTIKVLMDDKVIDFDAKINYDNLEEFVNQL